MTLDDKVVAVVDQYGPGRELPFEWSSPKLKPGKHTIRLSSWRRTRRRRKTALSTSRDLIFCENNKV